MYYTYMLINPRTDLPFYVGVGKRNRKSNQPREYSHISEAIQFQKGIIRKGANRHKLNTILQILTAKNSVKIEITKEFESEFEAFNEEIKLIAQYGRRDLGTGILTNLTDGGEGRVNPSAESRLKASLLKKGIPSHAKGKILGNYSNSRKQAQKEKMAVTRNNLTEVEKQRQYENRSNAHKGKVPWNKGLTKDVDERVAKYANCKTGKPRVDMLGKVPWNKGLTKDTNSAIAAMAKKAENRTPYNKGKASPVKGKTYEEIYGPEKAAELIEIRRIASQHRWDKLKNSSE